MPSGAKRVLVTGGSGTLGTQLLPRLVAAGHDVRAISRRQRPAADGVRWSLADLRASTGTGVAAAVAGVDVVVHCASAQRGDMQSAQRLLDAVRATGATGSPPHLVYISIVGVDRIPLGYYRTKHAVEQQISASGVPYTIVRATQFHDLIVRLFTVQGRSPVLLVPAATNFQPVDAGDVADRLAQCVDEGAAGRAADVGGPQVAEATQLARWFLAAAHRTRRVVPVKVPGRVGRSYRSGAQLAPEHAVGTGTFEEFLAARFV